MILEYAQLMSTAHRLLDGTQSVAKINNRNRRIWTLPDHREQIIYKPVSWNHPSAIWVRKSRDNYSWLYQLMVSLCKEYTYRYGKTHKVEASGLMDKLWVVPAGIPEHSKFTELPQAMPNDVKVPGDSIAAYHNYYRVYKKRFATWKNREIPNWYK